MLKARAVLAALMALARSLPTTRGEVARALLDGIEEIEASSGEFAQLRVWSLIQSGMVQFDHEEQMELERLSAGGGAATQLGLAPDRPRDELLQVAATRAARWRARLEHPLTDRQTADACGTMAWAYRECQCPTSRSGREWGAGLERTAPRAPLIAAVVVAITRDRSVRPPVGRMPAAQAESRHAWLMQSADVALSLRA